MGANGDAGHVYCPSEVFISVARMDVPLARSGYGNM